MPKLVGKSATLITVLAAAVFAVAYMALNWIGDIDDAYIFFRYAQHIADGYGYVFNIGQPAIEGTTSLAWTLLLVGFEFLGTPLAVATKILGVLSVMVILAMLGGELHRRTIPGPIIALALSLLIFNQDFIPSIMMGLETGLYAVAVLGVCLLAVRTFEEREGGVSAVSLGGMGLLLFLTRPESIGILALIGAGLVYIYVTAKKRSALHPVIIWIAGIIVVSLWRWFTFGDFIPNSARAKSVLAFSATFLAILWPRIEAGWHYAKDLVLTSPPLFVFGTIGLFSLRKRYSGYIAGVILLVGGGTVLLNAGDWMPFSRLLTPYLPLVALLAAIGLNHLRAWLKSQPTRVAFDASTLLLAGLFVAQAFWLVRDRTPFDFPKWPSGQCYEQVGLVLHPYLSQEMVLAPEAVGIIGYTLPEIPILDFFGLTEAEIAHNGVIPIETYTLGKHDYEYVMQERPQIFIFHSHITNHIPLLNQWGYAQNYDTFNVHDPDLQCQLIVGLEESVSPTLQPVLSQEFEVESIDISTLQPSPAATWPLGQK